MYEYFYFIKSSLSGVENHDTANNTEEKRWEIITGHSDGKREWRCWMLSGATDKKGLGRETSRTTEAIAREKVLTNVGISGERKAFWDH